jgi:predicted Zn-dependent protease
MSMGERMDGGFQLGPGIFRLLIGLLIALIGVGAIAIRGCQHGPFGRHQIVAINPQQEAALGAQAYQEVLSQSQVLKSGPIVDAVKGVARRLIDATGNQGFLKMVKLPYQEMEWQVQVVRDKQVNAFCLPGGKIVVYTAILPVCETDAGLATVMGHEIAHALAHHGAERMAQQQMAQVAVTSAGSSMGDMDPAQRQRMMQVLNAGARFGILSYSRKHESEADHVGLLMMATAGYDPRESVRFWERMRKQAGGGKTPEFLSTHPSHETRIRDLERWMPEALRLYESSGRTEPPKRLPGLR